MGRIPLTGEVPSPVNPPSGCHFHPRCPHTRRLAADLPDSETVTISSQGQTVRVVARCAMEAPTLRGLPDDPDHAHACLLKYGDR